MVTFVREVGEELLERGIVTAATAAAKAKTRGILMFSMPELTGILYSLAALSCFYNSMTQFCKKLELIFKSSI